jgi:hypothetical protein
MTFQETADSHIMLRHPGAGIEKWSRFPEWRVVELDLFSTGGFVAEELELFGLWPAKPDIPNATGNLAFAGEGGGHIYSGLGSVWLADAKSKTVTRFDPKRIAATLAD